MATIILESVNKEDAEHLVDGVYLSENGFSHLNTLLNGFDTSVCSLRKKKRINLDQGDQGIMDSIESVIAAGVLGMHFDAFWINFQNEKKSNDMLFFLGESPTSTNSTTFKEGMVVEPGEDGKPPEPPEGFNIFTNESGVMTLKKKRIRKIGKYKRPMCTLFFSVIFFNPHFCSRRRRI